MRALFLNHPEADYGEYFLYNGLCEILGADNVWDVPFKKSYHGTVHTYPGYIPANDKSRAWGLCGQGPMGVTAPFEWSKARAGTERSQQEVLDACRSNSFDLVVVGSPRTESIRHLRMLKPELRTDRIVLHDGEDYSDLLDNRLAAELGIRLCLKRELIHGYQTSIVIKPFPFSCALEVSEEISKTVDVLCAVGETNPARGAAKEVVRQLPNAQVLCGHWGWPRYVELLYSSKIAVAPRGFGQDTVRRWEIPAFDTLLMSQKLDLIEENTLQHGVHCSIYSNTDELRQQLEHWLRNPEQAREIALSGRDFVRTHHTNRARAQRMLDYVKEVYG